MGAIGEELSEPLLADLYGSLLCLETQRRSVRSGVEVEQVWLHRLTILNRRSFDHDTNSRTAPTFLGSFTEGSAYGHIYGSLCSLVPEPGYCVLPGPPGDTILSPSYCIILYTSPPSSFNQAWCSGSGAATKPPWKRSVCDRRRDGCFCRKKTRGIEITYGVKQITSNHTLHLSFYVLCFTCQVCTWKHKAYAIRFQFHH